ncbi:MAG: two pore domain potassium channel family protein [Anaerolineales bacterium]|nr:two pore domain potassium channel family protein [Anaerolineales bacterium]
MKKETYGDFAPTTPPTKLITIFYGLNGVILLLMLLDAVRRIRKWDVGNRTEVADHAQ